MVSATSATRSAPPALGVGVIVWLSSELMFFAALFATYFTLRSSAHGAWPPAGVHLGLLRPAVFTAVLMVSSGSMHVATTAARRGDRRRACQWLGVTALLGAIFLSNQALEYADLPFSISTDAYGSIFYLLTGFHGLHVLGGLVLMAVVAAVVGGRGSRAPVGAVIDVMGYYWHFVDIVWLGLFTTIYLIR